MSAPLQTPTPQGIVCPACQTPGGRPAPELGRRLRVADPASLLACRSCGLAWVAPGAVAASVTYEEEYFEPFELQRSFQGGVDRLPPHLDERLDRMLAMNGGRAGRLLEVGCGFGQFITNARARGWNVYGTDVSRWVARGIQARYGINVEVGDILDVPLPSGVDCVHLNHVLEHLPQPAATLARLHSTLRSGGLLVIEVPNESEALYESVRWRLLGQAAPSLTDTSPHLAFYTPRALRRLAERVGFRVVSLETARREPDRASRYPLGAAVKRLIYTLERRWHAGPNIVLFAVR